MIVRSMKYAYVARDLQELGQWRLRNELKYVASGLLFRGI